MKKERLDILLLEKENIKSRNLAQAYIREGRVSVNGRMVDKPGTPIKIDSEITIKEVFPYVSRGGLKLEKALEVFSVNPKGKIAADIGSSTGGFTDLLLQKGVKKIYAVDVNINQLDYKLQNNQTIIKIKKNGRFLEKQDFKEGIPEIFVMDVSFISVLKILPALIKINKEADFIILIKPQFEGKREYLKKGIVKDKKNIHKILLTVYTGIRNLGLYLHGVVKSPVKGQKGNKEYLFYLKATVSGLSNPEEKIGEVIFEEKE